MAACQKLSVNKAGSNGGLLRWSGGMEPEVQAAPAELEHLNCPSTPPRPCLRGGRAVAMATYHPIIIHSRRSDLD